MIRKSFINLFFALIFSIVWGQEKQYAVHTVAFYNVENLFDTIKSPNTFDAEFTPNGQRGWGTQKYNRKLNLLAEAISQIGTDENPNMPTILGVSEIENRAVLEDLIKEERLQSANYGIIHFDSPDRRGIDVGLLYQPQHFVPTSTKSIPLYIYEQSKSKRGSRHEKGKRIYTRDQLLVTGLLEGEEIHLIVNHWPSRYGGEKKSSPNREGAAELNRQIIDSLYKINPNAKIITMGDFNDGPYNKSMTKVLGAEGDKSKVKKGGLYNPMYEMHENGLGTLAYRDAWDVFDQMIASEPLIRNDFNGWQLWKTRIFNKPFLIQRTGRYRGYPLRNQLNGEPGYSDHFPVYMYLIKEVNN